MLERAPRTMLNRSTHLSRATRPRQNPLLCRDQHNTATTPQTTTRIPPPTPFVPDAKTFLTLIGRGLSAHASKFPSWDALFSFTSEQLRDSGIEPTRSRRYLLHQRERFRQGVKLGIGADLKHVTDGVGKLKIVEVPISQKRVAGATIASSIPAATLTTSPGMRKVVVNVPLEDGEGQGQDQETDIDRAEGVKIARGGEITGPWIQGLKAGGPGTAKISVQEGLWEQRRGHKVDGGERRKAEVRFKRRIAENKAARR